MDWDRIYTQTQDYFGADPDAVVEQHEPRLPRGARILDIGAGQGRNALHVARCGHTVDAIDLSALAMRELDAVATRDHLSIHTWAGDIADFVPTTPGYDAVLVMGLLPILSPAALALLVPRLHAWTAVGGLVILSAFTVEDPGYARCVQSGQPAGKNAFRMEEGGFRTFLEPGEAVDLLPGFRTLSHHEGLGPEHRHGDGPLHRHGFVELVSERTPAAFATP